MSELRKAAQQALQALEYPGPSWPESRKAAADALRAALAEPEQEQEPLARAWQEGYNQGVNDERTSEANIGIAGFEAKVEPARQNPYRLTAPTPRKPLSASRVHDLCGECHLDWHRGWSVDDEPNRYLQLVRAVEAAHGITNQN